NHRPAHVAPAPPAPPRPAPNRIVRAQTGVSQKRSEANTTNAEAPKAPNPHETATAVSTRHRRCETAANWRCKSAGNATLVLLSVAGIAESWPLHNAGIPPKGQRLIGCQHQ